VPLNSSQRRHRQLDESIGPNATGRRRTGTRRPPGTTDPASVPCRLAERGRVVAALRTGQGSDTVVHQHLHHLQRCPARQSQETLLTAPVTSAIATLTA
jgi:hypothetical protein